MNKSSMDALYDRLRERCTDTRTKEPMKKHTTFQVGGPADYFITPGSTEELRAVLELCREEGIPFFILGHGSNLLVSDQGYRGAVIHIGKAFSEIRTEGTRVTAGAGAMLSRVAMKAWEEGLTGLEFASGIPGTLGGAMVMNAGAYGGEMVQVVKRATVLTKEGALRTLGLSELDMGYRKSCILPMGYVVLETEMELAFGDRARIRETMDDLSARRKEKQPLEFPSAGSTFKRPEGYFAGKLIMDAGLAGFSVGGACVSEKHCGFVVNRGGASAQDIMKLCREVRQRVRERFGVTLEMEVKTLGEFL